ncbi:hypothetical protein GCM10009745_46900 [Kribbella yunnanensis]|uniref:DUF2516 family protein n=1 Tax=Kribbella yunnanensis TaxID=190194 RepID=A0ABN2HYL6_9ACTN
MDDYLGIALGVLAAILYTFLKGYIQKDFGATAGLPPWVPKYVRLFLFCLVTALVLLAIVRSLKPDLQLTFWQALLAGFGYEATIEKLKSRPDRTQVAQTAATPGQ